MTDDERPPSLWAQAEGEPVCPYCSAFGDSLELRGHEWYCNCCSRCWRALTKTDAAFLKTVRILPD